MGNNYIDNKVTVWQRFHFSDNADMNKLIEEIKTSGLDYVIDDNFGFEEFEILNDTEGSLTVEENDGESTIEVYKKGEIIYSN